MRRFYHNSTLKPGEKFLLDAEQTLHAGKVLRLALGEKVSIFDGLGNEYLAHFVSLNKKNFVVEIIEESSPPAKESPLKIRLAPALMKGEKLELVIQKAVELGISRLSPIETIRTDVKPRNIENKMNRWRKIAIESTKQCGRATLLEIDQPQSLESLLNNGKEQKLMFIESGGSSLKGIGKTNRTTIITGPEGGWEDSEVALAKEKDCAIITLGGRILRAETAAIAFAGIIQNTFGDLN